MNVLPLALALLLAFTGPVLAQSSGSKTPDCATTNGPLPETWSGQAFAIDGDTLAGVGLKAHIRIWGIQAPELRDKQTGQEIVQGMRARSWIAEMLVRADQKVTCRPTKWDRYCRMVAQCTIAQTPAGREPTHLDLGEMMLSAGLAYSYYLEELLTWDSATSSRYARREDEARLRRVGLWREWAPPY